jgi:hypothetical protein
MRRPTRSPFHHSDLGGPFVAFAPEFRECDQDLRHEADSSHPLFYPTSHQRWSVLSMLIHALRHRRLSGGAAAGTSHRRKREPYASSSRASQRVADESRTTNP